MPLFRCRICGENFPGRLIGEEDPVGFYATRFIEATNADEASATVREQLRNDDIFNIPEELRSEDARIFFEEIVEVLPNTVQQPDAGFSFFIMGS